MNGDCCCTHIASDIAASKGILVVNSAGNSGGGPWNYIGAPADGDSVLTVGGVDSLKVIYAQSSHGPSFDGRVKPNVCAQGLNAYLAFDNGVFGYGSGTSFASPIMAGTSACLLQAPPSFRHISILQSI